MRTLPMPVLSARLTGVCEVLKAWRWRRLSLELRLTMRLLSRVSGYRFNCARAANDIDNEYPLSNSPRSLKRNASSKSTTITNDADWILVLRLRAVACACALWGEETTLLKHVTLSHTHSH